MEQNGLSENDFDAIKHTREDGVEYWIYSELAQVLDCEDRSDLDRVVEALKEQQEGLLGEESKSFIAFENKTIPGGKDYVLSRRGCRLLANCIPMNPVNNRALMYFRPKERKTGVLWKILLAMLIIVPIIGVCVEFCVVDKAVKERRELDRKNVEDSRLEREALDAGNKLILEDCVEERVESVDGVEYCVFEGMRYYGEIASHGKHHDVRIRKDASYKITEPMQSNLKYDIYGTELEVMSDGYVLVEPYCVTTYRKGGGLNVVLTTVFLVPFLFTVFFGLWGILFAIYRKVCENSKVIYD